jgi:hypothetical protein
LEARSALGLYVLLKGPDATVLKGRQTYGHSHSVLGDNQISFCNVALWGSLTIARGGHRQCRPAAG